MFYFFFSDSKSSSTGKLALICSFNELSSSDTSWKRSKVSHLGSQSGLLVTAMLTGFVWGLLDCQIMFVLPHHQKLAIGHLGCSLGHNVVKKHIDAIFDRKVSAFKDRKLVKSLWSTGPWTWTCTDLRRRRARRWASFYDAWRSVPEPAFRWFLLVKRLNRGLNSMTNVSKQSRVFSVWRFWMPIYCDQKWFIMCARTSKDFWLDHMRKH